MSGSGNRPGIEDNSAPRFCSRQGVAIFQELARHHQQQIYTGDQGRKLAPGTFFPLFEMSSARVKQDRARKRKNNSIHETSKTNSRSHFHWLLCVSRANAGSQPSSRRMLSQFYHSGRMQGAPESYNWCREYRDWLVFAFRH